MTLRQRIEQWRWRDGIVRRDDLPVAEKVALLRGDFMGLFIRRTMRAADAFHDLEASAAKATVVMQSITNRLAGEDFPEVLANEADRPQATLKPIWESEQD